MSKQLLVAVRFWQKGEEPNADTMAGRLGTKVTAKNTRRRQEQVKELKADKNTKKTKYGTN